MRTQSILFHEGRKASLGDRLYWIYESALKQAESYLGSIATADGEIFALRKRLFKPVNEKLINDDLVITLNLIQQDYRVIYDQTAITEEEASLSLKDDFNVKSRMVYGGLQIIALYFNVLNPLKSWFLVCNSFFAKNTALFDVDLIDWNFNSKYSFDSYGK